MMNSTQPPLSASSIAKMKLMAADHELSEALVKDDVCVGGLVVVLSNDDDLVVQTALETLLKLAEWPNLRGSLKDFLGMNSQLNSLIMSAKNPNIQEIASKLYSVLYTVTPQPPATDDCEVCSPRQIPSFTKKSVAGRRRRNSFFVSGVSKAQMITLQINGLSDEGDIEVCRSHLLTVAGVISITFDMKKHRAILRTRADLQPQLLANAIAQTSTLSSEQVIKHSDGSESFISFEKPSNSAADAPCYPLYVDSHSPVSGSQNVVQRSGTHKNAGGSWGFLHTIGSIISHSLYW